MRPPRDSTQKPQALFEVLARVRAESKPRVATVDPPQVDRVAPAKQIARDTREIDGEIARYEEYVTGLDDLPILTDPVAIPPPRLAPPDFRLGERRDARRHPREDGATARESASREQASLYDEYLLPVAPQAAPPKGSKKRARRKNKKRR